MRIKITESQYKKIINESGGDHQPSVTAMTDGLIKIVTYDETYFYQLQAKTMFAWVGITVQLIELATNVLQYLVPITKEKVEGKISDRDKKMILNNVGKDIIGGLTAKDGTDLRLKLTV